MISPLGVAVGSALAFALGVFAVMAFSACLRAPDRRLSAHREARENEFRPTRAQWHVYRALVAAAGDQRCVAAGTDFSTFLVFDLVGTPLLRVRYASPASMGAADHGTSEQKPIVPLVSLDAHTTLDQIGDRVGEALGDRFVAGWGDRPALMSARIGSTWG